MKYEKLKVLSERTLKLLLDVFGGSELAAQVFMVSDDGLTIHDSEGNIVAANNSMVDLTGYPRSELFDIGYCGLVPGSYFDYVRRVYRGRDFELAGVVGPFEYPMITKAGGKIIIRSHTFITDMPDFFLSKEHNITAIRLHQAGFLATAVRPPEERPGKSEERFTKKGDTLTAQERRVAIMIRDGLITKEIADELGVSARTVEAHRANIRRKLKLTKENIHLAAALLNDWPPSLSRK